jgi:hypothetical protein
MRSYDENQICARATNSLFFPLCHSQANSAPHTKLRRLLSEHGQYYICPSVTNVFTVPANSAIAVMAFGRMFENRNRSQKQNEL